MKVNLILGSLLLLVTSISNAGSFDVTTFTSDFHKFSVGDVAPNLYFTREYNVRAWNIRHLPPPGAGNFWSYMDGTYVLLRSSDHKIIAAKSADIFYKRE